MSFKTVTTTLSRVAGRGGLILKKYSPEILMGTGIVGIVGSTILACRATLKAETVIEKVNRNLNNIHTAKEMADKGQTTDYTEQDYKKDLTATYIQAGWEFTKLYAPAVTLGVISIGCILGAHGIMRKRNLALMAAYKAVEGSFAKYRKRVIEDLGADKDRQYRTGVRTETVVVTEIDENGKKKKVEKTTEMIDPNATSEYARFFDESSRYWSKTAEYNLMTLTAQQNHANDILNTRGYIFLNEVYDMLGIPMSQAGAVVGWVKGSGGDDYVDFGIYEAKNMKKRDFVNGYERSILLDFNVDGVIFDKI